MNQVVARQDRGAPAALVESVIIRGDLSELTPEERISYYQRVCESAGLNPLTKPFEYLRLNGRLVLYALRAATDQLRKVHGISVVEMTKETMEGVHIVTVKVRDDGARTDMATGAVNIGGLKGEALANALMKAETKAKRRATLSICGLGLLDETEVEAPAAETEPARKSSYRARKDGDFDGVADQVRACKTVEELSAWRTANAAKIDAWPRQWAESFYQEIYDPKLAELKRAPVVSATLSSDDSAKLLTSMIKMMGRIESRLALKSWVEDPQVRGSIETLTEDDRDALRDGYASRLEALPEV